MVPQRRCKSSCFIDHGHRGHHCLHHGTQRKCAWRRWNHLPMSATRKVHNATEGKGKGDDEIGYQGEGKRNTSDSWKEKNKNKKSNVGKTWWRLSKVRRLSEVNDHKSPRQRDQSTHHVKRVICINETHHGTTEYLQCGKRGIIKVHWASSPSKNRIEKDQKYGG